MPPCRALPLPALLAIILAGCASEGAAPPGNPPAVNGAVDISTDTPADAAGTGSDAPADGSGTTAGDTAPPADGGATGEAPGDAPGTSPDDTTAPPTAPATIYGVTVDDPWRATATAAAITALPRPILARVVFDEGMAAREYVGPVRTIAGAGGVMGEILDSFFMPGLSVDGYRARAREYVSTLGADVDVWEIGNEVNGEWLGSTSSVVAKIRAAHEEVRAAGGKTAITLYYNEECWADPRNEMFAWVEANLPAELRADLDYVWVSFYEDDCNGIRPDWKAVFDRLGPLFPGSQLGFGECGTSRADRKVEYLRRWYGTRPDSPRFVGGWFWWYFSDDMVPSTLPLWQELYAILAAAP